MGELDEMDFGADTDAIRRWLAKRATYAGELGDPAGGGKHREDPPGTVDPRQLSVPNARDAGQHVLDALVEPEPPVARRWPTPYQPARKEPEQATTDGSVEPAAQPPVPTTSPPRAARDSGRDSGRISPYASTPEHEEELTASRSTNAVFEPRTGARRIVNLVLVLSVLSTVGAGYLALQERTTVSYGVVVLIAVLTLVVWAIRATTTVTELAIIRGQLELIRDGRFEVVDLASPFTPVLVEGRPGRRGWRVLVERHDQPLLVIDSTVVDPYHFTAVLQRIRPDLRQRAATSAR